MKVQNIWHRAGNVKTLQTLHKKLHIPEMGT